ncbi:MAG: major capsid protein [Arizlama microvirus]|nr:MAG: major capsid protein [Arizlama microvirus]
MSNRGDVFNNEKGRAPGRSAFDLSHEKKFTCDMGQIIPVLATAALPGDVFQLDNSCVIRFQPMVAPILHQVDVETFYFFVPYRLLDEDFETFITKGIQGTTELTPPLFDPSLFTTPANVFAMGGLWDFLGFPLLQPPPEACPMDYPRRAYYKIWNEYFRDETLQTELDITAYGTQHSILNAAWRKDYFTSSLPWTQRGTAPALPVFGSASAEFTMPWANHAGAAHNSMYGVNFNGGDLTNMTAWRGNGADDGINYVNDSAVVTAFNDILTDNNTIDGSAFTSVDIADFRLTLAMQVWMERNARGGARYNEVIRVHWGVAPNDARLQRPEFIGGTKNHAVISEVLQTSAESASGTTTPQGNLAGHGIAVQSARVGKYRVEEFGIIMGLMVVRPKSAYQDGINRQWLWRTAFDFPWPEFAGLSEQAIYNAEICTQTVVQDPTGVNNLNTFGYTGRYNEMRFIPDMVCSEMRTTFNYWHLGRQFNNASPPALNAAFIECVPRKDIFAVPSVPGLIVSFGNHIQAIRALPFLPIPNTMGV